MGNGYCNNCDSGEDSGAEYQSHKPNETNRRDIRCGSCDKWTLTYTESQKERYKELVKERTSIPGTIEEVKRFSTWGNNNLATVIAYYNGYYRTFLLVYDSAYSTYQPAVFPVDKDCNYGGDHEMKRFKKGTSLQGGVDIEAEGLRDELIEKGGKYYNNPILLIHPYCDCSRSFDTFVISPYVVKKYSTHSLKPLDIVKTYTTKLGFGFYHAGVYLGKIDGEFKVCHFTSEKNDTTIDQGSSFVEGEVIGYHPIVPFKNYKDIAGQIVGAKDNHFRKDSYNLPNRNCEHLANMCVYGINFSEQAHENERLLMVKVSAHAAGMGAYGGAAMASSALLAPFSFGLSLIPAMIGVGVTAATTVHIIKDHATLNNGKTSICLSNEIRETNDRLGKKSDGETEKYEKQYLLEVPPKENCRII